MRGGIQVAVVVYVDVVVGDAGTRHSESEVRQKEYDALYVGKQADFGIEEASFVVRPTHDVKVQIHHRRHHHRPSFPCQ